jgi:hypothetical protein
VLGQFLFFVWAEVARVEAKAKDVPRVLSEYNFINLFCCNVLRIFNEAGKMTDAGCVLSIWQPIAG